MAEVGCLKDGCFQNLQVEGTTIVNDLYLQSVAAPVLLPVTTPQTLVYGTHDGRTLVTGDAEETITIKLPTPTRAGQTFHFIYGGADVDASDIVFRTLTEDNSVVFKGAIQWINNTGEVDNGTPVIAGANIEILTLTKQEAFDLHLISYSPTVWYIWGWVGSAGTPQFS